MSYRLMRIALVFIVAAAVAGCRKTPPAESRTDAARPRQQASNPGGYPAPRWPSLWPRWVCTFWRSIRDSRAG